MSEEPIDVQVTTENIAPDKALPSDNANVVQTESMSNQQLRARRNALVKELFRVGNQIHPPKPSAPTNPSKPKSSTDVVDKQDTTVVEENKVHAVDGVPLDLYDYFDLPVNSSGKKNIGRLRYIAEWILSEGREFNKGMRDLHNIDTKLGGADMGETKLVKIYNWIRFSGKKR